MKPILCVLVALLVCAIIPQVKADNFVNVAAQIARFQDPTGPFFASFNDEPSLEATVNALYLVHAYGLQNKINSLSVLEYLESLRTNKNGYAVSRGGAPEIQSTLNAVLSYRYLGVVPPQQDAIIDYILSLEDSSTNLFGASTGSSGTLKATYQAVFALDALNEINRVPSSVADNLPGFLQQLLTSEGGSMRFEYPGLRPLQATFYSLYLIDAIKSVQVPGLEGIPNYILSQQLPTGGFGDYDSAYFALASLEFLERSTGNNYVNLVRTEALYQSVRNVAVHLSAVTPAHKAISHTQLFGDLFKFAIDFGTQSKTNKVVQGSQLTPEIVVRALGGPSHSGLQITVTVTDASGSVKVSDLNWEVEQQRYVSAESIDTSDYLGALTFEFQMNLHVFGIGVITFDQKVEKYVGYNIFIIPTATHTTGRTIQAGEQITSGTEFEFDVKLSNKTVPNLRSGDFKVELSVFDSSAVEVYQNQIDARNNGNTFHFTYSLLQSNFPAGEFTFRFSVAGDDGKVHSIEFISYELAVAMVATEIEFEGAAKDRTFNLGKNLQVSIIPASLPDFKTRYGVTDARDTNIESQRKFTMDISTSSGLVLQTVNGIPRGGKYIFEYFLSPNFDLLGSYVLTFRYETASGKRYTLDNFDSIDEELMEDALTVDIAANLVATIIERPTNTDLNYGNEVTVRLSVVDQITNQQLVPGRRGGVFMTLFHRDQGRVFTSNKQPAVQEGEYLVINWEVNPNAVSGPGTITLVAEGADGSEVPLLTTEGKPFSLDVTIGGQIQHDYQVFSTNDFFTSRTAFVVEFSLACNDVPLRNVKLKAVVSLNGNEIQTVNVGVANDKYVAAWTTAHTDSPSGTYRIDVYREADQTRAAENIEFKQKQLRQKKREAELSGAAFDEAQFLATLEDVTVEPLFTVNIAHKEVKRGGLPVRFEVVLGLIFVGTWVYIDFVKSKYLGK